MSGKYFAKFISLVFTLVVVLFAIYVLKNGGMGSFWSGLGLSSRSYLNWCQDRVVSMYFYESSVEIRESKRRWVRKGANQKSKVLDYLAIEKWFAKNCQVPVQNRFSNDLGEPFLEVEFTTGQRVVFYQVEPDLFRVGSQHYSSPFLNQAFQEILDF